MSNNLTITALIPCFNAEDTIVACINSVLNQSEPIDELIIIDDESTDGSVLLIKKEIEKIGGKLKVTLHEQRNQGPSAARNLGVALAKSNYIAFLDSDDHWEKDHIKQCKIILNADKSYKIVATRYKSVPHTLTGEINFNQMLYRNYLSTPCVVVDRNVFLEVGGFNEEMHYAEDYALWLNIIYHFKFFKIDYIGAKNIIEKRSFGEKGLSANLKQMHKGVLTCYKQLFTHHKINLSKYFILSSLEYIKYIRRIALTLKK